MAELLLEIDSRDDSGNTRVMQIPLTPGDGDLLSIVTGIALTLDGQVIFATGLRG
jgi:hypothetical protein